jgi:proprotein convertase subtilisin/kexin type 5
LKCYDGCATCTGPSNTNCTSCTNDINSVATYYVSALKKCVYTCPDGFIESATGNACTLCDSTCRTCEVTAGNCTSCQSDLYLNINDDDPALGSCVARIDCKDGTYGDELTNLCIACSLSCSTCYGPSSQECYTCNNDFYFYDTSCLESCPSGFWAKSGTNTCEDCLLGGGVSTCKTCSDETTCTSCDVGRFL